MSKKRNPQDATLRNVRARAKRLTELSARLTRLEIAVGAMAGTVQWLAITLEDLHPTPAPHPATKKKRRNC